MIYKKVRELYSVDTISQDKGWKKILTAIEEMLKDTDDDIQIDFTGVNVVEPWILSSFKQLIKIPNVNLLFTNNDEVVSRIKMMFILDGLDESRVTNIKVEVPVEKTADEQRVETYGRMLIDNFEIDNANNKAVFKAKNKYSQMFNTNSIAYIRFAIGEINRTAGITYFLIDLDGVKALNNVLELFAQMILDYSKVGITLEMNVTNEEDYRSMGLFMHTLGAGAIDTMARAKKVKEFADKFPNAPGILIKYKKSRALDEFGRQGKGEPVMSRISILRGVRIGKDSAVVVFETYNNNTFYTKQHWLVQNDNEMLTKLQSDIIEVPMAELGFLDEFIGTRYHFIEAVQRSESESTKVIVEINEAGSNVSMNCTIPERMAYVFDDWNIEYSKELLDIAIEKTTLQLKEKKNQE